MCYSTYLIGEQPEHERGAGRYHLPTWLHKDLSNGRRQLSVCKEEKNKKFLGLFVPPPKLLELPPNFLHHHPSFISDTYPAYPLKIGIDNPQS